MILKKLLSLSLLLVVQSASAGLLGDSYTCVVLDSQKIEYSSDRSIEKLAKEIAMDDCKSNSSDPSSCKLSICYWFPGDF
jgi:hypothetical protein